MDIAYASDDNFAWILGVSMLSLMEHNRGVEDIHFHVLDGGISEKNREKLTEQIAYYGRTCSFYTVQEVVAAVTKNQKAPRGSTSMFSRLFLDYFLPKTVERVLYIDCDTIILGSLEAYWGSDFDNHVLVAVNDCFSDAHRAWIHLPKDAPYFNSGVLLINMKLWRASDVNQKIADAIRLFPKGGPYGDQCLLNLALSSSTKLAHPKHNCLPYLWKLSYRQLLQLRRPSFYYSEKEVQEAVTSPVIVHFATFFYCPRPWVVHQSTDEFCVKWRYYLSLSLWSDNPLEKDKIKNWYKRAIQIFHSMPAALSIPIVGLLHARIMPFIGKMRT